jgi:hypothetical protein
MITMTVYMPAARLKSGNEKATILLTERVRVNERANPSSTIQSEIDEGDV